MLVYIFLSSGLFLGWSLGANDAANVFGSAVGSQMVKFRTAAVIAAVSVILGAGISGAGTSHTLGQLGSVNMIAGSFMVALAAAITVYSMTRMNLPVSTSQGIVGAIIGWNFFSGSVTDYNSLTKILSTWVLSPLIAAVFAIILYALVRFILNTFRIHLLKIDVYTRFSYLVVGAFGSYSLGANNIGNVMGVFVPVSPFKPFDYGGISFSSTELLFLLGGIAIAVGVVTYSYKVMSTVGTRLVKLTPITGLVVSLSSAMVLFLFASQGLESWLAEHSLPTIPLVPVSSSQVVVGAVLGIGLVQGGRGINFRILGKIASGWVITPVIAGLISFISLFFIQNVFNQQVFEPVRFTLSDAVVEKLESENIQCAFYKKIRNVGYNNALSFKGSLENLVPDICREKKKKIIDYARIMKLRVETGKLKKEIEEAWISEKQAEVFFRLEGKKYDHSWQLYNDLSRGSADWSFRPAEIRNKKYNRELKSKLDYIYRKFLINDE